MTRKSWKDRVLRMSELMMNEGESKRHMEIPDDAIFDLPSVLAATFTEWLEEIGGLLHAGKSASLLLLNADGEAAADAGDGRRPYGEQLSRLAVDACREGTFRSNTADGFYMTAVPLWTRARPSRPYAAVAGAWPEAMKPEEAVLQAAALHLASSIKAALEREKAQEAYRQKRRADREAHQKEALILAANRLYNCDDVESVLTEMLQSLERFYPESSICLFLSQDHLNGDARVRPLAFGGQGSDVVTDAFLNGRPVVRVEEQAVMALPMAGKQAVYGVLRLSMDARQWRDSYLSTARWLADTAGTAFENAKLLEQSDRLIKELRLINELTKRLNGSLSLNEIFQYATDELLAIFNADYCSVLQLDPASRRFQVVSCNFPVADEENYSTDYGFCGIIYNNKEPLILSDYWQNPLVESKLMEMTGSRSLIASPILAEGRVVGVILITHRSPNYFSYDNYKLLQVLSTHIGLAMTNASLHAEVRRMVITDNLTGLHARHFLNEQIQLRQRFESCGSLLLIDIDYFKTINDTHGHLIGDRILVQVSEIIRTSIRPDDIAARWGGEELAVYFPEARAEEAYRIAERIRARVESETAPRVTISCGLAEWTRVSGKITVESLFYQADMALYESKNKGRNSICIGGCASE
ncbi:hypothetical protein PACILC2_00500 [Paenibacillus cisolokensis]|uniref:GGDEF domain-containing protein n=1 Tax=Paenibacillus cisolokensis TaxID=1658519 RepID=A0ABQ4MZY9_9BACL|nr:sensor domain-containing diguanylate cyclase [Paenibacillus cisolokensis]GIQ61482.1 hypothetical protein PACILC2_00500 [Paenibacillus cisolokensis]